VLGVLLVVAQVAGVSPESTYASSELRGVVERAARANRVVPPTLASYRAHLESEMALIIVDTLGRERTGQVEQFGGFARWNADSGLVTNIAGYRIQTTGLPISMAGVIRNWTVPMLYGQRLLLGLDFSTPDAERKPRVGQRRDTIRAVHPFAADRELYYRYSGGDTITVISTATRRLPILRLLVRPNLAVDANFAAFDGEVDIDAIRHEIVRMRGRFVISQRMSRTRGIGGIIAKASGVVAVAYVEFINSEHYGRYWLPLTQRVELQTTNAFANGLRFTFRTVSRFSDFEIAEATPADARAISLRRQTIYAPTDSLGRFSDWRSEIGSVSGQMSSADFDDVSPPVWRRTGAPQLFFHPSRLDRVLRFNRIEGLFTGAEATAELRDLSPGTAAHAYAGWAWSEKTVRGGVSASRAWSMSSSSISAERRLVGTQDFQREFAGVSSGIGSFLSSIEEADFVDRRSVSLSHVRAIETREHALATVRIAAAHDGDVAASLTHGPIVRSRLYLPNRHARTGSYVLGALGYEFHPNVSGALLGPGLGATLNVEAASGDLRWMRTEGSISARRHVGPVTFATRTDAGVVISPDPPPQTLFELGGIAGRLAGYDYKEFAGDRAAVSRAYAAYELPLFRSPIRVRRWLLPGLTPGVAASVDAGWAELTTAAARAAVLEMGDGTTVNAVSRPTERIRSTAFVGLTFFSHSLQVGVARPIDQRAPWRAKFQLGQGF
jgi:hypothetical protein